MAENTAVSTQGKQEMNTQLSYYTNQYIGLMERDFAEHGLVLNDYSKQCVMASMSAIYNLVTSSKAAMSNLNGYTGVSADFQRGVYPIARCVKAENHDLGVIMADVNVIGSLQAKFESTSRIYDVMGCSPTLSTMQGGNREPKILEVKQLGFMDNGTGKHQSNTVYDENALCPNITTVEGGGTKQIKICESQIVAMRGRNPDNPSDRTAGNPTEQRLEVNMQGTSNCLTSVQKDNLLLENNIQKVGQISSNGSQCGTVISDNGISANLVAGTHGYANSHIATQYRIRKLTPRECGRLMGVSDEDIDKMAAVNSNTQLYKQFGNSIVVDVMCAMFKNLNINQ